VYDERYLAGILFFNQHDFFEAHEVWEALWMDCAGPERRFYQGLIQAAVGLFHFGNGNVRGAAKLYHTSRAYMEPYGSPYLGLDSAAFWRQMERCFAPLLADPNPERALRPDEELIPAIRLDPEPSHWPNPEDFVEDDE
jgi:predicted metal-dependent hydrolase